MRYLKLKSLPVLRHAHMIKAIDYHNTMPVASEKNLIEFCYTIEGNIPVYFGEEYIVQKEFNFVCNIYDRVTRVCAKGYHERCGISFYADYEILSSPEEGTIPLPLLITCTERNKAHDLLDKIIKTNTLEPENNFEINGLILLFLSEYASLCEIENNKKPNSYSIYVYKAKKYVYDNLTLPITQREVARLLGITPEYLSWVFKKHTGVSFIKFVNNAKLTKIKEVMDNHNLKLYQCAEMYGYNDANYVSKLYKKYYNKNITD